MGVVAPPMHTTHLLSDAGLPSWLGSAEHPVPSQVWQDGQVAAYSVFANGWLTDLYVAPEYQRQGLGTLLLDKANDESSELQLWTFQENESARRFYERNGFVSAEETDGHANEEKQPDVRYLWRKQWLFAP